MKPFHEESARAYQAPNDSVYYMLTLDPSVKDHRVIALLIDYTSRRQECPFYRIDDDKRHCAIAPEFTVMWDDCRGMCFVSGITCPLILDHVEGTETSNAKRDFTK